jgi:uncharacterized membrane protein YkoI
MGPNRSVRLAIALGVLLGLCVALAGCSQQGSTLGPGGRTITYNPPETSFATRLGITQGPVTAEQAKAIAAEAAGGTPLSVEQEDEDGTQVFGVLVQVGALQKDVKVRIADGAVTKIEEDGGDEGGEDEDGN